MPVPPRQRLRPASSPVAVALMVTLAVALVGVASTVVLLTTAGPASAHDELVVSSPADGARLGVAPGTVRLQFEEPVDPRMTTVVVSGPDGGMRMPGPRVDGTVVDQPLPPGAADGAYAVGYRVVSADGHPVTGVVRFSVGAKDGAAGQGVSSAVAPASDAHRAAPVGGADDDPSPGMPVGLLAGGAVLVATASSVARVARRHARSRS